MSVVQRPSVFKIELHDNNDPSRPSAPLVYYPGSTIAGNVVIHSMQVMKPLHQMKIQLIGKAHVNWQDRIAVRVGNRIDSIPAICTDVETTLELAVELWDVAGNRTTADGAPRQLIGLPAGEHKFPFRIDLPASLDHKLPSSYEQPIPKGYIRYVLTAGISQTALFQFDHSTSLSISISGSIDVNIPKLLHPLSRSQQEKQRFYKSSLHVLNVKTDRCGYCPGESIAITVETENLKTATKLHDRDQPPIKANLKQTICFCGKPFHRNGKAVTNAVYDSKSIEMTNIIQTVEGPGNWHNKLLPIPLIPPTIAKCRILKVSYVLEVVMKLKGPLGGRVLRTELPIIIGTIPYRGPEGSSVPTPDDPTDIDFIRNNNIVYERVMKLLTLQDSKSKQISLTFTPNYGVVHNYQYAPSDQSN
ncbi:arrestin domain-containing protein 4-like [Dysidea avara]|uniref:arrestin domain-containing protein 4-like n=1 Tax=Dysidea avara TaxID=196820 RepID=UPI00331EF2BB